MKGTLESELTSSTPAGCLLCAYLRDQLAPSEATEWTLALAKPVNVIGNEAVVSALKRRGVFLTEASVRRHRKHG